MFLQAQAAPVQVVGGIACSSYRWPILRPGLPWDPMVVIQIPSFSQGTTVDPKFFGCPQLLLLSTPLRLQQWPQVAAGWLILVSVCWWQCVVRKPWRCSSSGWYFRGSACRYRSRSTRWLGRTHGTSSPASNLAFRCASVTPSTLATPQRYKVVLTSNYRGSIGGLRASDISWVEVTGWDKCSVRENRPDNSQRDNRRLPMGNGMSGRLRRRFSHIPRRH